MPIPRVRVPFAFTALLGLLLPGCPLTDEYYIDANAGEAGPDTGHTDPMLQPVQNVCGDGKRTGSEYCDGSDLGMGTCNDFHLGPGTLICNEACQYDVSGCAPPPTVCGDGVAAGEEDCDLTDLRELTCAHFGFQGTLGCSATCDFDFAGCLAPPAVCGDTIAQGAETCDGADLRMHNCEEFGMVGTLECSGCQFDFSGCTTPPPSSNCGDAVLQTPEACDGANLNAQTCETLGFGPGTLGCSPVCEFDKSLCGAPPEECDPGAGAELCDGITNDCDEDIDEDGACPEGTTARSFGGHTYVLYIYGTQGDMGGSNGSGSGSGRWNQGGSSGQGSWNQDQQDYGQATTTCQTAATVLGLDQKLDLARIQTAEENEFLRAWIAEVAANVVGTVWMGANDLDEEGRWVWGRGAGAVQFFSGNRFGGGGTAVNGLFNDFSAGRPNSANFAGEDCGAFDSELGWHWNDLDCGVPRLGVLCEQLD